MWSQLKLADPRFGQPGPVELLLGAGVTQRLMMTGLQRRGSLVAQNTVVGWTIWGRSCGLGDQRPNQCFATTADGSEPPWHRQLLAVLQQFWQVEDLPLIHRSSPADERCEQLFMEHHRDHSGRYVVRLPLKLDAGRLLGSSESSACASLAHLHRRMARDDTFAAAYREFMQAYIDSGHMIKLSHEEMKLKDRPVHYIPHHGIWQHGDHGPRLRVVFDASRPTSSGVSLNDVTHRGPKLQRDIWTILLRWRRHRVAFCADMKMMYRQIWIDKRDLDWQRVVWSPSSSDPIQHFRLLTVTYGTSCAPYLALRTIEQLCTDEGAQFPAATVAILRDRYVDDVLSGAPDLEAARDLRDQLIQLTNKGGFPLRKWVANDPRLLEGLNTADCLRPTWISFSAEDPVRELGIAWNPQDDSLGVAVPDVSKPRRSKREVLSALATIFDPCGWLAPTTLTVKLLIQDMWRARLGWDDELPELLAQRWRTICDGLTSIRGLVIPRWLASHSSAQDLRIHAFADASRRAMAAVTYSRCEDETGQVRLRILVAKTKLAPIRSVLVIQRERRDQPSQGWSYGLRSSPPGSCVRPATSWPLTSTRAWPGRTQGSSSTGLIQPRRSAILWSMDTSIKSKN
ncbi:unnamed protein product [Trichogramma brassicae]|uniref:Reverse transcriptase domain-containing protein n=1 Tax=Trichogramma brassicae TaxID=86971 RepID=A0A6H5J1K0_9HYME|nr:unnamed protein product [Trichogramma brassicae]